MDRCYGFYRQFGCYQINGKFRMVLLEFSMFPIDQGESVSPYVARSLDIIDRSGLDYRLHSMGTVIEGEIDQVLAVVKQCFEAMAADCDRVSCTRSSWTTAKAIAAGCTARSRASRTNWAVLLKKA